jgi:hypothetical protein
MTKAEMSELVREIYMLMMSEESMYINSSKMAQFMVDREITLDKVKLQENSD